MEIDLESRMVWEEHEGKKYVLLNFQYCSDAQRIEISKIFTKSIENEAVNSVLVIVDMNKTVVSVDSMRAVKDDWDRIRPQIRKTALLGVTGFKAVLLKVWWSITGYNSKPFKSKEEALEYLFK